MNRTLLDAIYKEYHPKADVSLSTLHFLPAEEHGRTSGHAFIYEIPGFRSDVFFDEEGFRSQFKKPAKKTVTEKVKEAVKKVAKKK